MTHKVGGGPRSNQFSLCVCPSRLIGLKTIMTLPPHTHTFTQDIRSLDYVMSTTEATSHFYFQVFFILIKMSALNCMFGCICCCNNFLERKQGVRFERIVIRILHHVHQIHNVFFLMKYKTLSSFETDKAAQYHGPAHRSAERLEKEKHFSRILESSMRIASLRALK